MTVSNIVEQDALQAPLVLDELYSLLPIERGFDWETCFEQIETGVWYLVAFRSKHKADADEEILTLLDRRATEAAQKTEGFLYYFTGVPLATGECLSFCLWTDQRAARQGASHSDHRVAKEMGLKSYEYYCLERYYIHKHAGQLMFSPLPSMPHHH